MAKRELDAAGDRVIVAMPGGGELTVRRSQITNPEALPLA
jgi:hypothetical protein